MDLLKLPTSTVEVVSPSLDEMGLCMQLRDSFVIEPCFTSALSYWD